MSLLLNGTDGVTFNDGSEQWAAASPIGTKNLIINGDMRIDQRNAGASVTPTDTGAFTYLVDRFASRISQASKLSFQQSTTAPNGFSNSELITSLSAYSIGVSDHFAYAQWVEGFNIAYLGWGTSDAKTVTLSFWVRSSLTGTFGGAIYNQSGASTYIYSYTINSANTWEKKTITIVGDTTGTWTGGNGQGLALTFSLGAGSNNTRSVGWGSFSRSVTGQTNLTGTSGATFYITGVQLEIGDTATPFEHRPYDMEFARCQRYYQTLSKWQLSGAFETTTAPAMYAGFPVTMRSAPDVTRLSTITIGSAAGNFSDNGSIAFSNSSDKGVIVVIVVSSGSASVGLPVGLTSENNITLSAEL